MSLSKETQISEEVDKKKEILILKEELGKLKTALIEEFRYMKKSLFAEVQVLKNELLQDYDKDIPAEPSESLMTSLEEQILFLQKVRNKNKLISSLKDEFWKNSENISACQQQHTYTQHNNIPCEEETESTSATQKHHKTEEQK